MPLLGRGYRVGHGDPPDFKDPRRVPGSNDDDLLCVPISKGL